MRDRVGYYAPKIARGGRTHLSETTKWPTVAVGLLLAWCVAAGQAAFNIARERAQDPMARLDAEFRAFIPYLPATGDIGYLEERGGGNEATRVYYAAQYALAPRVVVSRVGPEFIIVPRGAAQGDADERLRPYQPARGFPGGHRLFVRLP